MSYRLAAVLLKISARAMSRASGHALPAAFVAFLRRREPAQAGAEERTRQVEPGKTVCVNGYTAFTHSVRGEVLG